MNGYTNAWTDRYDNTSTCLHMVFLLYKLLVMLKMSIFPSDNTTTIIIC